MNRVTSKRRNRYAGRRIPPSSDEFVKVSSGYSSRRTQRGESHLDLLHEYPRVRTETEPLRDALRFAIETGDVGDAIDNAIAHSPLSESEWNPARYSESLFLSELIANAFRVRIDGKVLSQNLVYAERVLGCPPRDDADRFLRQSVLTELSTKPEMRKACEQAYLSLVQFRTSLEEPQEGLRGNSVRRKVDLLSKLRSIVQAFARLASATSPLRRLAEFAERVEALPSYQTLLAILSFHDDYAVLSLKAVLRSDGSVKDVVVLQSASKVASPYYRSPWRRALSDFWGWLQGHRYQHDEVILRAMDDVLLGLEGDFTLHLFTVIAHLEFYLASLSFADLARSRGLEVSLAEVGEATAFKIQGVFCPHLLQGDHSVVANDLALSNSDCVLVTGSNSGGKTRLLQAIGFTFLLAHVGSFVPANAAFLPRSRRLFVSFGGSPSAESEDGRLGEELRRVRAVFEEIRPGSVVLIDELCSSTNPSEGIAILEMVLRVLKRAEPVAFLTTHFLDAAKRLHEQNVIDGLKFLQVELADGKPTHRFVSGVADTSLAARVATALGVTETTLIELLEASYREG